ncbi:type III secretion system cytoplasmic ring protein SctQ [Roseateles saccharophilus]|nr:type III secretion system cytoplasmic ring protein SctQ [Roseateles saccharophilus]
MPTAVIELSEVSALTRLPAPACQALNRLYDRRAPAIELMLRGERHRLQWRFGSAQDFTGSCRYRFRLGPHTGWLVLDAAAQAALLQERSHALLPAELRYVLLADALQPVATALEAALRLHFEWSPGESDEDAESLPLEAAACFSVAADGQAWPWQGLLLFQDPSALDKLVPALPAASAGPVGSGFDGLRVPLAFRIGDSVLSLAEVRGIRPGDIVSVERWTAAGAGLVVQAELGGPAGRQLIARAEGSRITVTQWRDPSMKRDELAGAGEGEDATGLPLDRLDALEVALRFEVGHLSLSLGELRNIGPGHVFDLTQPLNRSPVRILAHGNVLGKGFLVAVGERLGVRVSEFAPTELKS